jgi:hypothetical protein
MQADAASDAEKRAQPMRKQSQISGIIAESIGEIKGDTTAQRSEKPPTSP